MADGWEVGLSTSGFLGLFATINPTYTGRIALPDNLRSYNLSLRMRRLRMR